MNKKIRGLMIAAMCAAFMSGCTGSPAVTTPTPGVTNAPVETATPTPTPTPEEVIMTEAVYIEPNYEGIKTQGNWAKVAVHDPSIKVFDGKYYIYGSHMTCAWSNDMKSWTWIGNQYAASNKVYGKIFSNAEGYLYSGKGSSAVPTDDGGNHVWAPDVIYNEAMGKYCMYYCYSSTWNASNLALATADSPEGPFEFQTGLLYSGFTSSTIDATNVYDVVDSKWATRYFGGASYKYKYWPNCIDPSVFYDAEGKMWMVYGSWSGGIFILEIDPLTGLVIHPEADEANNVDPYFGKRLIGGNHCSIEGPYIHYEEKTGYYYLYVSYGGLAQKGGYQVRVFRSDKPNGEYVDLNGERPENGGYHPAYGIKLTGNYYLPSLTTSYMATGGQSAFTDTDGKSYLCFHSRFESTGEQHQPVVKQILYNEEGWPCLLPYRTDGETASEAGYALEDIIGDYYYVNMGKGINSDISQPCMITLHRNGKIDGSYLGDWSYKDGTCYMNITIDGTTYSGVFCKQKDMTGVEVMTFTAVGDVTSVWGVKY